MYVCMYVYIFIFIYRCVYLKTFILFISTMQRTKEGYTISLTKLYKILHSVLYALTNTPIDFQIKVLIFPKRILFTL